MENIFYILLLAVGVTIAASFTIGVFMSIIMSLEVVYNGVGDSLDIYKKYGFLASLFLTLNPIYDRSKVDKEYVDEYYDMRLKDRIGFIGSCSPEHPKNFLTYNSIDFYTGVCIIFLGACVFTLPIITSKIMLKYNLKGIRSGFRCSTKDKSNKDNPNVVQRKSEQQNNLNKIYE